jgi:hypothetical protein
MCQRFLAWLKFEVPMVVQMAARKYRLRSKITGKYGLAKTDNFFRNPFDSFDSLVSARQTSLGFFSLAKFRD